MQLTDAVPLELTKQVRDISVTERNSYKMCRRQWYLTTVENLEPTSAKQWYFDFGTGIHSGLEGYYKAKGGIIDDTPYDAAIAAFDEWYDDTEKELKEDKSYSIEQKDLVLQELYDFGLLGVGMLENYAEYALTRDDFTVVCVEGTWTEEGRELIQQHLNPPYKDSVPVLHESGRFLTPILNQNNQSIGRLLSARLDLVVYIRKVGLNGFWVIDHKTAGQHPSDRGLDMDDQPTGYGYTFWRLTGVYPRGTIFNYLVKQLPKEPRLIREGDELSTDKAQLTTAPLYREALERFGYLKNGQITSEKHAGCYAALLSKGWSKFFERYYPTRNKDEYMSFHDRLPYEAEEMAHVAVTPELIFPHLNQYGACSNCSVKNICQAIEDGSDYDWIADTMYRQAPDRKAI